MITFDDVYTACLLLMVLEGGMTTRLVLVLLSLDVPTRLNGVVLISADCYGGLLTRPPLLLRAQ